jgi:hypothetical protein
MTQSLSKWTIGSVFEKDDNEIYTKDALILQDVLRYFLVINQNPLENRPFVLRDLQLWIVNNSREITEQYPGYKGRPSHIVHAKEFRINRIFNAMIILGLIEKWNKTSPASTFPASTFPASTSKSMYVDSRVRYVYTKSAVLLNLIMRNLNLENAISMEKDPRKINNKKTDLDMVNNAIYQLFDSTLPTGNEYPSSNIFYKSFYKKIRDKGHFSKIIAYAAEMCQYTKAENMKELLQEYYVSDFAIKNKSDRKTILQLWSETLEEQSQEVRDIVFYQQKLITERRFEYKTGHFSREYERQRFNHRADHENIVLVGTCEKCNKQNVVIWSYTEYRIRFSDFEGDDLIRFDCQRCGRKDSCVIPNF